MSSNSDNDSPTTSPDEHSTSLTTIGLISAVVALILIIFILLLTKRFRGRNKSGATLLPGGTDLPSHRSTVMDPRHPAARITPFSPNASGVRDMPGSQFDYKPGENMRVAMRRPDGAWDFVDPASTQNSPYGATHLDGMPVSSSTASFSSYPPPPAAQRSKKEEEAARWRRKDLDYELGVDSGDLMAPPPAYGQTAGTGVGDVR
ncbi:hypothetical protein BDV98DRAFT_590666 [Pterulicium gracile]|uniref:Uncharacterized protein n=1 Tax=Pterulicium gracile TaxID=1884261 RepID=A0A5C3QZF7_9AGAR|nr:hypothetical protein BDV98DRAFT_590666 [Pterula gracilis]